MRDVVCGLGLGLRLRRAEMELGPCVLLVACYGVKQGLVK